MRRAVASGARAALADYDRGIRLLCSARGRRGVEAEAARWLLPGRRTGPCRCAERAGLDVHGGQGRAARRHGCSALAAAQRRSREHGCAEQPGLLYATGQGLPHDHARAAAWFRAAADQGSAEAARNLHVLIHGDDGAPAIPRGNAATAPDPRLLASNCRL
jgi:TPR repeat protein